MERKKRLAGAHRFDSLNSEQKRLNGKNLFPHIMKPLTCRLKRWKNWAGVVGLTTNMLTSSASMSSSRLSVFCYRGKMHYNTFRIIMRCQHNDLTGIIQFSGTPIPYKHTLYP